MSLVPPIAGRSPSKILRQLYAFKSGTRHSAAAPPMAPLVAQLHPADKIAVAAYAASLTP